MFQSYGDFNEIASEALSFKSQQHGRGRSHSSLIYRDNAHVSSHSVARPPSHFRILAPDSRVPISHNQGRRRRTDVVAADYSIMLPALDSVSHSVSQECMHWQIEEVDCN